MKINKQVVHFLPWFLRQKKELTNEKNVFSFQIQQYIFIDKDSEYFFNFTLLLLRSQTQV